MINTVAWLKRRLRGHRLGLGLVGATLFAVACELTGPSDSIITEGAAFFGVSGSVPAWEFFYSVLWTAVVLGLGYWRFRRMDLS